jgi:hypothetical protein
MRKFKEKNIPFTVTRGYDKLLIQSNHRHVIPSSVLGYTAHFIRDNGTLSSASVYVFPTFEALKNKVDKEWEYKNVELYHKE